MFVRERNSSQRDITSVDRFVSSCISTCRTMQDSYHDRIGRHHHPVLCVWMRLEGSVPGNPHPESLLPPLSPLFHQLHTTSESSWTTLSRTTEVIAMERSPVKDRNYRTADASTPPYQGSAKREARVRSAPLCEARIRWISRAGAYAITACPRRPLHFPWGSERYRPACEV
jgi:hypothetical protein